MVPYLKINQTPGNTGETLYQVRRSAHIPQYLPESLKQNKLKTEKHYTIDASELTIAAVGYIMTTTRENENYVGFVLGKAKLVAIARHGILYQDWNCVPWRLDARWMLASPYQLKNSTFILTASFMVHFQHYTLILHLCKNYVSYIRKITRPEQWNFIPIEQNPTDQATRLVTAHQFMKGKFYIKWH